MFFKSADYVSISTSATTLDDALKGSQLGLDGFEVFVAAGVGVGPEQVFDNTLHNGRIANIPASVFCDYVGEWFGIARRRQSDNVEYLAFGDEYGYCPVFYSLISGRTLIISDSFYGVRAGLYDNGVDLELDVGNYLATLSSKSVFFSNPTVRRTMAVQIEILPIDKALLIGADSVERVSRSEIGGSAGVFGFDEAIARGVDFVAESLRSLASASGSDKTLFLSGGVDSRLLLALCRHAGVSSEFSIRSADPRNFKTAYSQGVIGKDIRIAETIRNDLGLRWWIPGASSRYPVSFRESLASFQSYRSNFSYAFGPQKAISVYNKPVVALRGGGGEMLRSTNTSIAIDRQVKVAVEDGLVGGGSEVEKLSAWFMRTGRLTDLGASQVAPLTKDVFESYGGTSVLEIMNLHYLNTRNRTHFGHLRFSHIGNEVGFHFLSNGFFKRAAELSPIEERVNGSVVRAIFGRTFPNLLEYPFENDDWTSKLVSGPQRRIVGNDRSWVEAFEAIKSATPSLKVMNSWSLSGRFGSAVSRPDTFLLSYLRRSFGLIESVSPGSSKALLVDFHDQLLSIVEKSPQYLNELIAKVSSAVDVFFPAIREGFVLDLSCDGSSARSGDVFRSSQPDFLSVPQDGWNNAPVIEIAPSISQTAEGFLVDANVLGASSLGSSFAYYLFKDGSRVDSIWYTENSSVQFGLILEPGTYSAIVFVRYGSSKERVEKFRTGKIYVK